MNYRIANTGLYLPPVRDKFRIRHRRLNHRGNLRTTGRSFDNNRNCLGYLLLGRLHSLPRQGIDRDRIRLLHSTANELIMSEVIFDIYIYVL